MFHYLGGTRDALESGHVRVGRPVALKRTAEGKLRVQTPSGKTTDVPVDDAGQAFATEEIFFEALEVPCWPGNCCISDEKEAHHAHHYPQR